MSDTSPHPVGDRVPFVEGKTCDVCGDAHGQQCVGGYDGDCSYGARLIPADGSPLAWVEMT
jgi:hypothetical protein